MSNRAQLRTSSRIAADQENSDYPTDESYNDLLDRAASAVYRRLVASGWVPNRTTVSITANGALSYTLGTDVQTVLSVQRIDGTTSRVPLRRLKLEEFADFMNVSSQGGPSSAYQITGGATTASAIEFFPTPTQGLYEVRYIPQFAGFVADTDNWYGPAGSDELIILTVAADAKDKEDDDSSALRSKLGERWADVIESAQWQDGQGQQTVRDVRDVQASAFTNPFNYNATEGWY